MGMVAEEGDRPKAQVCGPRTQWGQSEGKIEQRERSHWFVGTQLERDGGAVWNLPSSSLPPPLFPIKEFREWE